MVDIEPPGNPFSVPHESCKYCDTIRLGSVAEAEPSKHAEASAAMAKLNNQCLRKPPLGKVFNFVNHDLIRLLKRILVSSDDIKDQMDLCLTRCRYARGEFMFSKQRCARAGGGSAEGLKTHASRLPAHHLRKAARGSIECGYVSGNVEGLNYVLRIVLLRGITPAAELNVHLAIVLIAPPLLECNH